jgi:hypothetical protein
VTILNIGVIDLPYAYDQEVEAPISKKGKARKKTKKVQLSITTGEVAEYIENEYHVMETFYEVYQEKIIESLSEAILGDLDNTLNGRPPNPDLFAPAAAEIELWFKRFLSTREIETVGVAGVPTQAALDGVNHRLKHPYSSSNARRPSFIDTGLYQSSVKVWIEP